MEKNDYLKAARILATCPKRRLPMVVKLLRESGVEVDESILDAEEDSREALKMERRGGRRESLYAPEFWKSDDEFVFTLRNAFERGIGISKLSRETGISRTSLYRYLHEESRPAESDMKCILDGIDKIMNGEVV